MTQTSMIEAYLEANNGEAATSIQSRFEVFDRENPQVYAKFKEYSGQLLCTGRRRFSANFIIGRIRWDYAIETNAADFKINNDYTPFFPRMLIAEDESFRPMFELRKVR